MKKKETKPERTYKKPRLYLDDLEEIVAILESACDKITIEDKDNVYDGLDDLIQHNKGVLNRLEITCEAPDIRLKLSEGLLSDCSLILDSSEEDIATFYKVDTILRKTERKSILDGLKRAWLWVFFGLVGLFMGSGGSLIMKYPIPGRTVQFMFAIWSLLMLWRLSQPLQIILKRKNETESFLHRNKDALIRGLILVIISAGLSIGGTLLVQRLLALPPDSPTSTEAPATTSAPSDSNPTPDK